MCASVIRGTTEGHAPGFDKRRVRLQSKFRTISTVVPNFFALPPSTFKEQDLALNLHGPACSLMATRYAFVTLITSDSYLPGALTLAAALRDIHPKPTTEPEVDFQTACLVTPETVDVSSIKLLRGAFDVVIGVEVIDDEDRKRLELLGESCCSISEARAVGRGGQAVWWTAKWISKVSQWDDTPVCGFLHPMCVATTTHQNVRESEGQWNFASKPNSTDIEPFPPSQF